MVLVVNCSPPGMAPAEVEVIGTTVAVTVSSSPGVGVGIAVDVIGMTDVVTCGVPGQSVTVGGQEVTVTTVVV